MTSARSPNTKPSSMNTHRSAIPHSTHRSTKEPHHDHDHPRTRSRPQRTTPLRYDRHLGSARTPGIATRTLLHRRLRVTRARRTRTPLRTLGTQRTKRLEGLRLQLQPPPPQTRSVTTGSA